MRAVLYARVSTVDHDQNPETQTVCWRVRPEVLTA